MHDNSTIEKKKNIYIYIYIYILWEDEEPRTEMNE